MNNLQAFFALVRAGLWEDIKVKGDNCDSPLAFTSIDWSEIFRLASEQTVTGLVAQGIETVSSADFCRDSAESEQVHSALTAPKVQGLRFKVPQKVVLQFVGQTLQMEQRNKVMNAFIAETVEGMRSAGIYTLLVKGQGIAQCYVRPMWRTSGDVDLFLNNDDYQKAKAYLAPLASNGKPERRYSKEIGYYINQILVELHGTLHTGLSSRVDNAIDNVQREVFGGRKVRSWDNSGTPIFLPGADEDVFLVFTHFIKHFYKEGGVTLRQLCDWCRLLYTYRDKLDYGLLESRVRKAGLMNEWRAFAAVAVEWLGMPMGAMPLYDSRLMVKGSRFAKKVEKIVAFILKGGEWQKWRDTFAVGRIFPWNTIKFSPGILLNVNWR